MPTTASPLFRQLTDTLSSPVAQDLQDCVLNGHRERAMMLIRGEGYSGEDAAALFEQCLERWAGADVDMTEVPLAAMQETIEARERRGVSGEETSPYLVRYGTSIRPARAMVHRGQIDLWTAAGRMALDSVQQFWLVTPKATAALEPAKPKRQFNSPAAADAPLPGQRPVLRNVNASNYVDDTGAPTNPEWPAVFLWTRLRDFISTPQTGKWCVVRPPEEIDALWAKVRAAVLAGQYPAALVSSHAQAALHGGTHVICLFTSDWSDENAVRKARDFLRSIGVVEEIGYKRDVETINGVYGTPDEFIYRTP